MRVGVVGAGGIAPAHIDGWAALGIPVALLRRSGTEALAGRYGIPIIDDLDELIEHSDILDIISPTATHLDIARRAFANGKHVVCEKPLAGSADDARALADAAQDAGVRLFPAHVVRYFPGYRGLKDALPTVGPVIELTFRRTVAAPASAWFFAQDAGGGLIRDLMIHDIDQALWLAGPVVKVSATQDPSAVEGVLTPPVSAHVTLTHRSGAISHLRADWFERDTPFRSVAEVVGTSGSLRFDTGSPEGTAEGYLPPVSDVDPYRLQLADFLNAIRTGGDAAVTPEDGVAAVQVVDAAYASLAAGAPVRV